MPNRHPHLFYCAHITTQSYLIRSVLSERTTAALAPAYCWSWLECSDSTQVLPETLSWYFSMAKRHTKTFLKRMVCTEAATLPDNFRARGKNFREESCSI